MAKHNIDPMKYGVPMDKDEFCAHMEQEFMRLVPVSVDELLLHPAEAHAFCDTVRQNSLYQKLPDDVILRAVVLLRKAGP